MGKTISIIIPAYNEEAVIGATLDGLLDACSGLSDEFEIVVVNDCSKDRTGAIVAERARANSRIRLVNNEKNLGYGGAFMRGIQEARMESGIMVCADNSIDVESLRRIFSKAGEADLVTGYVSNPEVRELSRRIISKVYVFVVNFLTGFRLRYYNGITLYPTAPLKELEISKGFAYAAQIIVTLLNRGYTYVEVPYVTRQRENGTTNAFKFKNILSVVRVVLLIALRGRSRYWTKPDKRRSVAHKRAA